MLKISDEERDADMLSVLISGTGSEVKKPEEFNTRLDICEGTSSLTFL